MPQEIWIKVCFTFLYLQQDLQYGACYFVHDVAPFNLGELTWASYKAKEVHITESVDMGRLLHLAGLYLQGVLICDALDMASQKIVS